MTSTLRSSSTFLAHHKTQFLTFLDHLKNTESSIPHLTFLAQLCFSPHLEVSTIALAALSTRCKSDSPACSFLQTLKVPSASPETSSELVPFAGRLCSTLTEHVSEMKSLFAESSSSDATISTISTPLPDESPFISGNAILGVLNEGFSLLVSLLFDMDNTFQDILIDCNCVPLLKSTIITCLDLLSQPKASFHRMNGGCSDNLINILDCHPSLFHVIESAFSDVQQLCALLERTCCLSSPNFQHLRLIINITAYLPTFVAPMLEEKLVQRVINTSKPMTVPTTHDHFHLNLIWTILNLVFDPEDVTKDKEERKRIRKMQFECVLRPAKQYLLFILQREEFIQKDDEADEDLPTTITDLLARTLSLEHETFEDGEIVETGREEWEVGWLVEMTDEESLELRLENIREDDERMRRDEKERWKKRVSRQREAGHEDAMEGWLMQRDEEPREEIVNYLKRVSVESGMNNTL
ncbi:hypothetical protein BLNAU_4860 [Blattamonas nauphoetae]|uniref:Uncharacterized protein n=1 Tax=Blattamonas nauphoetae TaxID=2049346 RepID=A0ABQ9Y996_9EUKA|nr:hypothetical protein BLNAU_4860 [Blattamonas nauphoetae]